MYEENEKQVCMTDAIETHAAEPIIGHPDQDDRYPGTFFRIPGVPVPGKTTWSLN